MWPWNHMGPGWGWAGMFVGGILLLLFLGALIVLAFFAIRALTRSTGADQEKRSIGSSQTALEILQERYARGELTREEYIEMRREIET